MFVAVEKIVCLVSDLEMVAVRDGYFIEARRECNLSLRDIASRIDCNLMTPMRISMDSDRFNSCQVIYSQFGLAIHQNDHQARRRFVEWAQNGIAVVPDFHKRILFSDEAHFWLNGYVNKQNCRIWSEANPQVYVETPLHPEKLTVCYALWAGGIIGPYFFKNDEGHNVTVNGDWYRTMITNFFIPELNNHDVQELWFQQDGATCHTARATIDLLKDTFGEHLISRFGPVNWPPRSCDLTPLDYFLWGYVKSLVYADKLQTLDHLEDNIRRVISDIRPQMLEKSHRKLDVRLDYIRASRGSPMPEIIFKIIETCSDIGASNDKTGYRSSSTSSFLMSSCSGCSIMMNVSTSGSTKENVRGLLAFVIEWTVIVFTIQSPLVRVGEVATKKNAFSRFLTRENTSSRVAVGLGFDNSPLIMIDKRPDPHTSRICCHSSGIKFVPVERSIARVGLTQPFQIVQTLRSVTRWREFNAPPIPNPKRRVDAITTLTPCGANSVKTDAFTGRHSKSGYSRLNNAFRFVEWAQNKIAVVPDFHKRILFSDEAHFWLNGYVNKQNCRIWSEANPQVYVETPLHPEKLTVWCALWAGGILLQKR
ncbi:putative DD41D transposase [Trichonephila clavipes]|nr:putative DD41D transposase [Trichonephila clavipes]